MFPVLVAGSTTSTEYQISNSVRLRASATTSFTRTPAVVGSTTTYTWSGWVKRGASGSPIIFGCSITEGNAYTVLAFNSSDFLAFSHVFGGVNQWFLTTAQVFRDPAAWYHIVAVADTTNTVAADRLRLYVNGTRVTAFSSSLIPTANASSFINSTNLHAIGRYVSSQYFDGYLAEMNFIDGQALTANSFGEFSTTTGVWKPKRYTGNYGTNGFYLPFTDKSSPTNLGVSLVSQPESVTFWTATGSAAISTAQSKFSGTSVTFPGGTSGLTGSTTLLSDLNGIDWTIEGWIYPTALTANNEIFGSNSSGQVSSVSIKTGSFWGNKIELSDWQTSHSFFSAIASTSTVPLNTWTHYAFTKQGTTLRCFFNGNLEATTLNAVTTFPSFTCVMGNRSNGDLPFVGFMDDTRITRGICRYTASFPVPTAPYTLVGETNAVSMLMSFDTSITVGQRSFYWTPNGISLTAGATYDSMIDTPTPYPDGSNGRGNYCTMNVLDKHSGITMADGNLKVQLYTLANGSCGFRGTIGVSSGKWYWEVLVGANQASRPLGFIGIDQLNISAASINTVGTGVLSTSYVYYQISGNKKNNNTSTAYGASYATNDVIGVAFDADVGTLTFYKNGVSQGQAFSGISGTFAPSGSLYSDTINGSYIADMQYNFGQRPFTFTPPTGFKTLNTYNLPEPTIIKGKEHFSPLLWTGLDSGPSRSISGTSFAPDMIWTKNRSSTYATILYDRVRGAGAGKALSTFTTDPENVLNTTQFGFLSAFSAVDNSVTWSRGSAGASATKPDGYAYYDQLNNAYVSWNWKVNGSTSVTNTAGTLTSQVSINPTAGVSVVRYTGNGVNGATIGHGLGVAPNVIICHNLDVTSNWRMYHSSLPVTFDIVINSTAAQVVGQYPVRPTSTVWTVTGSGGPATNGTGNRQLAYCFSEVAGYSKFSSYIGNGLADGPYIYCGFRPAWIMTKRTDNAFGGDWYIYDTVRSTYNAMTALLSINTSAAEGPFVGFDSLSNGFKVRSSAANFNASGGTYIFMAFAENPFKYSLAR